MSVNLDKSNGFHTSGRPEAIVRNASTDLLVSLATRSTERELSEAISEELDVRYGINDMGRFRKHDARNWDDTDRWVAPVWTGAFDGVI